MPVACALAGAGGRGEACLNMQILQNGASIQSRPAPPCGGAANLLASPLPPAPLSQTLWLMALEPRDLRRLGDEPSGG